MEHISKSMSPSGKIDSAPRDFVVYGLNSEKDPNPVKLGSYSYSQDLDPLQYFEVKFPSKVVFPYIELDIISNHGNVNYTCLYRFRVHGVLPWINVIVMLTSTLCKYELWNTCFM